MSETEDEIEWITAGDSWALFRKGAAWLRSNNISRKQHEMTGQTLYSSAQIKEKIRGETTTTPDSDDARSPGRDAKESAEAEVIYDVSTNVKETAGLLRQVCAHLEKMFVNYEKAHQGLFTTLTTHLARQNDQVILLEDKAIEMRAVLERAMSLEHERKLDEDKHSHRKRMQEQALSSIMATALPWIQQKFAKGEVGNGSAPLTSAPPKDETAEKVGAFTIQVLQTISDEQFAQLEKTLGPDVFGAMVQLRMLVKT